MKKHQEQKTKFKGSKPIHDSQADAAGIDVGANEIWVAVGADRSQAPVKRFGAFTQELKAIVQWLLDCRVRSVAMARIIWTLITRRLPFDLSFFALEQQANDQRRLKGLSKTARQMGFQLIPIPA